MEYLNSNNIIVDNQHGFRSSHSCQTQLISLVEDITYAMDNHFQVDIMLLDFAKAFDRIPHKRLLHKLSSYGIDNCTHQWIKPG